jgi:hypothetical protein
LEDTISPIGEIKKLYRAKVDEMKIYVRHYLPKKLCTMWKWCSLSDQEEISNDFNINVAKTIGDSNVPCNDSHVSVSKIKETFNISDELFFKPVSENFVKKQIGYMSIKRLQAMIVFQLKW